MKLQVAILGAGRMGRIRADSLADNPRIEIMAVADKYLSQAESVATRFKALAFDDHRPMIDSGPDILFVCTPNTMHAEPIMTALSRGIHVFCEKPMVTTLIEAAQVRAEAEKSRAILQVGFNRRFSPAYRWAIDHVESGRLVPRCAVIKTNRGELKDPPWVGNPEITGGFLYEWTIHQLDMVRQLMGDVYKVRAQGIRTAYEEADSFAALLSFESGTMATLLSTAHATWTYPFERVELFGDHATLVVEEVSRVSFLPSFDGVGEMQDFGALPRLSRWGYREEVKQFVDAVESGGPSPVSVEEGYRAVELVEAVSRSAERGGAEMTLPLPVPTRTQIRL